jgi:hypothetical protein
MRRIDTLLPDMDIVESDCAMNPPLVKRQRCLTPVSSSRLDTGIPPQGARLCTGGGLPSQFIQRLPRLSTPTGTGSGRVPLHGLLPPRLRAPSPLSDQGGACQPTRARNRWDFQSPSRRVFLRARIESVSDHTASQRREAYADSLQRLHHRVLSLRRSRPRDVEGCC